VIPDRLPVVIGRRVEMKAENLLQHHGDQMYRLIRRTVYDREVHADLFQEVFVRVMASLPNFERRSKLSTWIHSVTIRTCYDHLRRARRNRHVSFDEWMNEAGHDIPIPATALERVSTFNQAQVLDRNLSQLPLKFKLPIHLFYVEELSYKEIAEALQIPIGTVKTNLFRGLRKLREIIGGELDAYL
jgi:RNA polymerase sigma-70 factor (ECF subfamily)